MNKLTNQSNSTQDTEDVVALLAAEIMAAMRRAKFPKDHVAEAHDEFEALTLVPMIRETLLADRQSLSDRIDELEGVVDDAASCLKEAGHTISRLEHGSLGNRNFAYVAADHARAALHQEGIATDVGR